MEKLAIFDVDYTLTKKETLVQFYKFILKKKPALILHAPSIVFSGLMYALKILKAGVAKEIFIGFIDGITEKEMQEYVKEFYEKKLSKILYVDAIDTMKKLKNKGYKVYLISASAEFYLNELYNIKEVDKIIGTRFTLSEGSYNRKIIGENCKGEEKVKRLKQVLKEENIEADFKESCMFSDSLADLPLFKLVGNAYLINSKKKYDNIENLQWK